jgi:acyl-CoA-binding protein
MVKHIVMWKLFDEAQGFSREENAQRIKIELENLKEQIAEIHRLEVGINQNQSPAAFDVVLYSEFEDWEALKIYQAHPKHEKLKQFIAPLRSERAVVDYQI